MITVRRILSRKRDGSLGIRGLGTLAVTCALMLAAAFAALDSRAAVDLGQISATAQADGTILVYWRTETEFNTSGFSLYRAETATGPWDNVIDTQPAQGDGSTPTDYNFVDDGVTLGVTYYYMLEELRSDGSTYPFTDRIVHATAGDVSTPTSTPTITPTSTPGPSPTPTLTGTPTPTSTPTPLPTDTPRPAPTATRQYTNTPRPVDTALPTATPLPGRPTQTHTPTVTPFVEPKVATPTGQAGAFLSPLPTIARSAASATAAPAAAAPTATRPSAQTPTDTPTAVPTSTPSPVSSPVVFGTNATAAPILRNTAGQAAAATTDASPRQGEGWALAIGLGSVVLAAILGGAAMVLWRRRRS